MAAMLLGQRIKPVGAAGRIERSQEYASIGAANFPDASPVSGHTAVDSRTRVSPRQEATVHRSERSSAAIALERTW